MPAVHYPQVFEPLIDRILDGTMSERSSRETVLRQMYLVRRRYNNSRAVSNAGNLLGEFFFDPYWTLDSQRARIESVIAFLEPLVGDTTKEPAYVRSWFLTSPTDWQPILAVGHNDAAGNYIPVAGVTYPAGSWLLLVNAVQ